MTSQQELIKGKKIMKIGLKSLLLLPLVAAMSACGVAGGGTVADTTTAGSEVTAGATSGGASKESEDKKDSKLPGARTILDNMDSNLKSLKSYTLYIEDPHDKDAKSMLMSGFSDSSSSYAKFVMHNGSIMELRALPKHSYLKADEQYWKSAGGGRLKGLALAAVTGKWVESPTDPKDKFGLKGFEDMWEGEQTSWATNLSVKVAEIDYGDGKAIKLTDRLDDSAHFIVQREAPHHLLEFSGVADETKGPEKILVRFSDLNAVKPITAPPAAEILKIPGVKR